MAAPVNSKVLASLNALQQTTMSQQVVRSSGAGKAYQSVAQSMAIAVQDASDHLRNLQTISGTTVGVASAMMIAEESPDPWTKIITESQKTVATGTKNFTAIGDAAIKIATNFPSG